MILYEIRNLTLAFVLFLGNTHTELIWTKMSKKQKQVSYPNPKKKGWEGEVRSATKLPELQISGIWSSKTSGIKKGSIKKAYIRINSSVPSLVNNQRWNELLLEYSRASLLKYCRVQDKQSAGIYCIPSQLFSTHLNAFLKLRSSQARRRARPKCLQIIHHNSPHLPFQVQRPPAITPFPDLPSPGLPASPAVPGCWRSDRLATGGPEH